MRGSPTTASRSSPGTTRAAARLPHRRTQGARALGTRVRRAALPDAADDRQFDPLPLTGSARCSRSTAASRSARLHRHGALRTPGRAGAAGRERCTVAFGAVDRIWASISITGVRATPTSPRCGWSPSTATPSCCGATARADPDATQVSRLRHHRGGRLIALSRARRCRSSRGSAPRRARSTGSGCKIRPGDRRGAACRRAGTGRRARLRRCPRATTRTGAAGRRRLPAASDHGSLEDSGRLHSVISAPDGAPGGGELPVAGAAAAAARVR